MDNIKKIFQPILSLTGYYRIKSQWRWRQSLSKWAKEDNARRLYINNQIETINGRILPPVKSTANLTVSLTSHGKRVSEFAPYAIWHILKQTKLPNRIVLNIDKNHWTQDSLPELIKKLKIAGLEVNLCTDIGPHTKFLPTLQNYPNDIIITVDDDIIYGGNMIEMLWNAYENSDKRTIICHEARRIKRDKKGALLLYSQWENAKSDLNQVPEIGTRSPYGYRGVLYPPHIFSQEILNTYVFEKLCPKADDIWFTIMEILDDIPVLSLEHMNSKYFDIDRRNEFNPADSDALHFSNAGRNQNDVQLLALKKYYNL